MNYSIKRIKKNRKGIFSQHMQETEKIQVEISNIIELHLTNWFNRYCVNKPGMEIRREGNSIAGRNSRRPILKSRDPTIRSPADPLIPPMNLDAEKCARSSQKHPRW